ncbi:metallopeptidase family protein [Prosthecobacter dejongeii]|uniref:Putative Zn-dependent protease with MMP-like domain n=1 Tax=Prosthecobacter dejongeii TaxID=48465 RepID=A0A7W7YMA9_9BACT|nr:metallopeptidase family protein [Prosthecobacter dejongeii]MBB5038818.1 putative Zn-dependent protease with MMP-like domain [Prosthecobacter dejongeii]
MTDDRLATLAAAEVRQTLRGLPEDIREAAAGCVIEPVFMADCLAAGEVIEDDILGLFEGNSRADPEPEFPGQLPRIRLFLDNLWDYTGGNPELYREEVRVTLLHELGHYLGFDEAQVAALGLA